MVLLQYEIFLPTHWNVSLFINITQRTIHIKIFTSKNFGNFWMLQWNGFLQTQKVNVVCCVDSVRHSVNVMSNWKGESLFCLVQNNWMLTKTIYSYDIPIYCLKTLWKTRSFISSQENIISASALVYCIFWVYISRTI